VIRVASWNVNSLRVRLPQVLDWLQAQQPDLLALQETKLTDPEFPAEAIEATGYRVVYAGQKTYNGVATLSRGPARDVVTELSGLDDPQRRVLGASYGSLRLLNLYVPNGSEVGSDKYAYKLDWLDRLANHLDEEMRTHEHLLVLGDFNIAPQDRDVHDPKAWEGMVLCSEPERAAFQRLLDLGLCDTFRRFEQGEGFFSWWDYRAAAFRRNNGLRIDHILASPALCERCLSSRIDMAPRRLERPSDHAPVVAEFDL
jgi:exodeoxyribonuclease-3